MKFHKFDRMAARIAICVLALALICSGAAAFDLEITNVNIDNFPGIHVFCRVTDEFGVHIADLSSSNFELREDGILVADNVVEQYGYMAVTLVMDQSGSMGGHEQDVIDACTYFVNGLEDLDKGAIVKFATTSFVDVPMTYNKTMLLNSISLYATGGSTDLYDAINLGIQQCYPEPEKKAVVTFTDGNNNQPGVWAAQLPGFAGSDITLYNIGIGDITPDSLIYISEETGGFYLPISDPSQMQQVLVDIRQDIQYLYDVFYTSPSPAPNGSVRDLELVCTYQGVADWDTISYEAPLNLPPLITMSATTMNMLGTAQPSGAAVNVSCQIRSNETITTARIYYKNINAAYYTQANLVHGTGVNYYYNIPGSSVQNPGAYFYLQATDDEGATTTAPSFQPAAMPLCFTVLPNSPPVITYEAPEEWLTRRDLPIEVTVTDATSFVSSVKLYYRVFESFFFTELPMTSIGNNKFQCTIEGPQINEHEDLEMFIAAWDNNEAVRYWNWADAPYYLPIVPELGPTPPAVILEPQNLPIIIPAAGGNFFYVMKVINPIPDFAESDAWADFVLPSGAVQAIGLIEGNIVLIGGEIFEDAYAQAVAGSMPVGQYLFRMHTGDYASGEIYYTDSFEFTKQTFSAPAGFHLEEAFPNPFNAATSLQFYLPEDGLVTVAVYNIAGKEVARLVDGFMEQGVHRLNWDANLLPSGTYFCKIAADQGTIARKMLLVK